MARSLLLSDLQNYPFLRGACIESEQCSQLSAQSSTVVQFICLAEHPSIHSIHHWKARPPGSQYCNSISTLSSPKGHRLVQYVATHRRTDPHILSISWPPTAAEAGAGWYIAAMGTKIHQVQSPQQWGLKIASKSQRTDARCWRVVYRTDGIVAH